MTVIVLASAGALVVVLLTVFWNRLWRIPAPDEALIVTGLRIRRAHGDLSGADFKIVTGHGVLTLPGVHVARKIYLDSAQTPLEVDCVTTQAIPVKIRGVVLFKVGDDHASIASAARRFLGRQDEIGQQVHDVFAGHLRAIVGKMTVEEMIRNREKLAQLTRSESSTEMEKLGLIVDSLQIHEIHDFEEYISKVSRPFSAAAERVAIESEQESAVHQAEAKRNASIADVAARQKVVEEQTRLATLEAVQVEEMLLSKVRRPADANAYEVVTRAEAAAKAARLKADAEAYQRRVLGEAEAHAVRVNGLAEAEVIRARGEALASNREAVIGQQLAENWPDIVRAGAEAFGGVDNLVVLNGASGLSEMLANILSQGAAALSTVRSVLGEPADSESELVQGTTDVASGGEDAEPGTEAGDPMPHPGEISDVTRDHRDALWASMIKGRAPTKKRP